MSLAKLLLCRLGWHQAGRYCASCGKLLGAAPVRLYRIKSRVGPPMSTTVDAINEQHAYDLVRHLGWHRDNLNIEAVDKLDCT